MNTLWYSKNLNPLSTKKKKNEKKWELEPTPDVVLEIVFFLKGKSFEDLVKNDYLWEDFSNASKFSDRRKYSSEKRGIWTERNFLTYHVKWLILIRIISRRTPQIWVVFWKIHDSFLEFLFSLFFFPRFSSVCIRMSNVCSTCQLRQ